MKELIEKRARLIEEIRSVLDQMKENPTSELEAKLQALEADEDKVFKQIEAESRQLERMKSSSIAINQALPAGIGQKEKGEDEKQLRKEFFSEFLKRGSEVFHEQRYNGLVQGNLTEGGNLVAPQEFVAELIKALDNEVVVRQLARKFTLTKAVSMGFPTLDVDLSDAEWTTEVAAATADTALKTGKREFKPNPVRKLVKASKTLIDTSAVPIETLVAERLAYIFSITQDKAFLTGNGASKPLGLFTASDVGISTSRDVSTDNTATAITFDGLINALYSLKSGYQNNATWLFHRDAVKMLRKIKDSQNQYIWQPSLVAGTPDMLLNRPVRQCENVPNTFSASSYVGLVGDFSYYWIVDALDFTILRLNELYAVNDQVGWIGKLSSDGAPVLQEAFARVKLAAS
jgi:HK97 family phage major capsid protein